ncbi:hypothetical protein NTE_01431 [Candidatus Nitrososphaera evergladensis SR1]|jgi:flagellar basal body-associated protein FliL|uniref:Uncharacterized protein n=1 Tax=Candidatus Nitrososphaera evergladensis SR1 TaxID=1459636 RepID=A0A075MQW8_9ARCH|nr:hypothetical protein [Candidatus Nitrososphaera evergladensis]AIF83495.1 hypothetical protein NTE_01431 [Candidatus Nitrososphaera evergladensis SR1]
MQKGLMIALIAAGIVITAAVAIAGVAAFAPGQQGNNNNNNAPPPTAASTGKNLTLNLNENLGLKGNAR